MLFKTISYQTTLFICMILGIKQIYTDAKLVHHFYGYRCLKCKGIKTWNSLSNSLKYITSTTCFKHLVNKYLLSTAFWLLSTCKHALYVWHAAFCLLTSFCDFWFYAYMIFCCYNVWFRPSWISCIFRIFYLFFFVNQVFTLFFLCFAVLW